MEIFGPRWHKVAISPTFQETEMQELNSSSHTPLLRKISQGDRQIIDRAGVVPRLKDLPSRIERGQQGVCIHCSLA